MIDLGPHAIFIVSSYVGAFLVTTIMIAWVWMNSKKQQTRLDDLQRMGIYRRSDKNTPDIAEETK